METCTTCGHAADKPYRRTVDGVVTEGCIDAFHNAHADAWHLRPVAAEMRCEGKILASYPNAEDGMTGIVVEGSGGKFHAVLRDDDSGRCVGVVRIEKTFEKACDVARKWANA